MKKPSKLEVLFWTWLFPAIFAVLITIYLVNAIGIIKYKPFLKAYLQQYAQIGDETVEHGRFPDRVQAVIVSASESTGQDAKKYSVSTLTTRLPSALRAKKAADVNVIVLVEKSSFTVGSYSDGQPALRLKWDVFIIDVRDNSIHSRNSFIGGEPPLSKSSSSAGVGSSPSKASLLKWLKRSLDPEWMW